MGNIIVNTEVLKNNVSKLDNEKIYFYNQKSTFTRGSYGDSGLLSSYIGKINSIYGDISNNISNLSKYIGEYASDVEGIENLMSGRNGYIKLDAPSSLVNKYKNFIDVYKMSDSNLFQVVSCNPSAGYSGGMDYSNIDPLTRGIATAGVCGLAFLEGVGNVAEMLVDGMGVLVSGACSLFGANGASEAIMSFVKKDVSGDVYNSIIEKTGLDRYANPDGTAANVFKFLGNAAGVVGLSVLTGGIAGSIGAAAGAGVAATGGTAAAVTAATMATKTGAMAVMGAVSGALMDAGSEAEFAMQNGAVVSEAHQAAVSGAVVGMATGAVSGKLNSLAQGAKGLGSIIKYGVAAFGLGSSNPLINEIARTGIYKHDDNLSFFDNFVQNAKMDNLVLQMGMAGTISTISTLVHINKNNNTKSEDLNDDVESRTVNEKNQLLEDTLDLMFVDTITEEIPFIRQLEEREIIIKNKEMNHLLENKELSDLYEVYLKNPDEIIIVPESLKEQFAELKLLDAEIKTGQGNLRSNEFSLLNKEIINDVMAAITRDVGPIKKLDDIELQIKTREYNQILKDNPIVLKYLNGEDVLLDGENAKLVVLANDLKQSLISGVGVINIGEITEVNNFINALNGNTSRPISFFQENFDYFMKKGMNVKDYLDSINVSVGNYKVSNNNIAEAALEFGDKKLLLFFRARELLDSGRLLQEEPDFAEMLEGIIKVRSYNIVEDNLQELMLPYLSDIDVKILDEIGSSTLSSKLTTEQINTIYQYTRAGGCEVCTGLRTGRYGKFSSLYDLELYMNNYNTEKTGEHIRRNVSSDMTIVDEISKIIDAHSNSKPVQAIRRVKDLGPNAGGIITPDNIDSFIGKSFKDDAFGSFSLITDVDTAYSKHPIEMIATIDTGCGTLIQNVSGLTEGTAEFLVKPGYTTTIIDGFYDTARDKIVLYTLVGRENKGLYNAQSMPLSNNPKLRVVQEKILKSEPLSIAEKLIAGRDHPVKELAGYKLKPDHAYRAISEKLFNIYKEKGFVLGTGIGDEYQEYIENGQLFNNNKGVDWYLGGVELKYGDIILECPADKEYFIPAYDNGVHLSADPTVRHIKSSGAKKPIPMSKITNIFDVRQISEKSK